MKRILTSIVLMTFLFPVLVLGGLTQTDDDLVHRDGLYYKKFTDVPFTGFIVRRSGRGLSQGEIKNGKKEGAWVVYYNNGQLSDKGTWKDGKKEGVWIVYYPKGQLLSKGTFNRSNRILSGRPKRLSGIRLTTKLGLQFTRFDWKTRQNHLPAYYSALRWMSRIHIRGSL